MCKTSFITRFAGILRTQRQKHSILMIESRAIFLTILYRHGPYEVIFMQSNRCVRFDRARTHR